MLLFRGMTFVSYGTYRLKIQYRFPSGFITRYQHERTLHGKITGDLQHQEFINTILVSDNFCSSQSGLGVYKLEVFYT
ncbi:hypothetical protein HanRHA438_Chr01g0025571 [Helianthus annuus]|nr:hypothetical protein HanRHA438_Chr01g0025571 [Helianthus annuus]